MTTKIDSTQLKVVTSDNPTSSSANKLCKVLPVYSGFSMTKLKEEQIKDVDIQKKITTLVINDAYEIIDGVIYKLVLHKSSNASLSRPSYRCTSRKPGKMNIIPTPNEVMGLVGMDYWGPTNYPTARCNRYVITLTDYQSKFAFARAVKTNSAQEATDFFLDVCYHYGPPSKLITDQGSHFVAELTRTIIE
ncbi:unnamed protein product [Rotaria socialis]|nr:unnamed protein product [Rotaria socialis]